MSSFPVTWNRNSGAVNQKGDDAVIANSLAAATSLSSRFCQPKVVTQSLSGSSAAYQNHPIDHPLVRSPMDRCYDTN
jgi:hypothetical protein